MRPTYALSRFRLSSAALTLAFLFALAGIYAVDRTLSESNRTRVQIEAVETGAFVESFLAIHAEALQSVGGLFLDTTRAVDAGHFHTLVGSISQYASAFRRIWFTDSAGNIVGQHLFGPAAQPLPPGLNVDTAPDRSLATLAARARHLRRAQISPPRELRGGGRGVILLEPVYAGNNFRGFVGATITSNAILDRAERGRPNLHGRLVILAGDDTVAARKAERSLFGRSANMASAVIATPGMRQWRIVVAQPAEYEDVRALLWGVGLATLGALVVVLLHEGRQSQRLAERSSELERLSVELLRANRTKSEFLANISHELRTPLNAIVGFVELLRDGVYGELAPRQVAPVDRIASSAGHLRQLVDQILDLAKMAAGRLEVYREVVDLRPFVLDVASEVEALVSEKGLNLSIAVSAALPRVHTDPMHLRQILTNLLSNAVKFTPSGGIAVRARLVGARGGARLSKPWSESSRAGGPQPPTLDGSWVAIQIADSGIGIAPADRERIFDEFEQVNAGPRSDSIQRGTGLGLPISRRLARLLGGDLTVESELGKGSTFTVWIPVESTVSQ